MNEEVEPENEANAVSVEPSSFWNTCNYRYALLLASYPKSCATAILIFLSTTFITCLCFSGLPTFDDPAKEFIIIGTPNAAKLDQLMALKLGSVPFPNDDSESGFAEVKTKLIGETISLTSWGNKALHRSQRSINSLEFCFESPDQASHELWTRFASMGKLVVTMEKTNLRDANNTGDFFTIPGAVSSLCIMQQRLEGMPSFQHLCSKTLYAPNAVCCPTWSLANFITHIVRKSSCNQLTEMDIAEVRSLTQICLEPFLSGKLKRSCWDDYGTPSDWLCPEVPAVCFQTPILLVLLATSLPVDSAGRAILTPSTLLVIPIWRHDGMEVWKAIEVEGVLEQLTENLKPQISIQGIDLGVYDHMATAYLLADSKWLALGACLLALLLLTLSRGSVCLVVATFLALAWSLVIAYGIYQHLFHIPTFPLINAMTIVLLLGLGADDILLFFQVWTSIRPTSKYHADKQHQQSNCFLQSGHQRVNAARLSKCLRHAAPSVCLTSFSTLAGLAVAFTTDIVAVKRFAAFASLTVSCHLAYVLLVLPILLLFLGPACKTTQGCRRINICYYFATLVIRIRYFFPVLVIGCLVTSAYFLFHEGLFTFPRGSLHTAFYQNDHPAEIYRRWQGDLFWAERTIRHYRLLLRVNMVWGLLPKDSRRTWTWKPEDNNDAIRPILRDPSFTFPDSVETRIWFHRFCSVDLKKMPRLFTPTLSASISPTGGYFEETALLASLGAESWCPFGRYIFSIDSYLSSLVCNSGSVACCVAGRPIDIFTTNSTVFSVCLREYARQSHLLVPNYSTGLHFDPMTGDLIALTVSATSELSLHDASFSDLRNYSIHLENWFSGLLATAPPGLASSGYLVSSELAAFDVYQDVVQFLPYSLGLAVLMTAVFVFASSCDLFLAVTALACVMTSLLSCCLLLVLFDNWSLGVVEALVLSLAAGLAVDPCLHLALAIARPTDCTVWLTRCRVALETVGCRAVTGAALSTAVAGASMLPAKLKCYHQMGVFLVALMISSWLLCGVAFVAVAACIPKRK